MPVSRFSGSWAQASPPTQVRLQPSVERDDAEIADLDLSRIDEDPITYFLTPAQPPYDGDEGDVMDFEMDFDAGIEDAKRPPPIVRSVSPSSLGGLSLPPPRHLTPPRRSASPDLDRDMPSTPEDVEGYMHLAARGLSHPLGLPLTLKDLTASKLSGQDTRGSGDADSPLSSISLQAPRSSSLGRPKTQPSPRPSRPSQVVIRMGRSRSLSSRRSHAWREPSPDVWSIEEETEEELNSEMGDSAMEGDTAESTYNRGIDIPAAKPKKKVRFVLPDRDEDYGAY